MGLGARVIAISKAAEVYISRWVRDMVLLQKSQRAQPDDVDDMESFYNSDQCADTLSIWKLRVVMEGDIDHHSYAMLCHILFKPLRIIVLPMAPVAETRSTFRFVLEGCPGGQSQGLPLYMFFVFDYSYSNSSKLQRDQQSARCGYCLPDVGDPCRWWHAIGIPDALRVGECSCSRHVASSVSHAVQDAVVSWDWGVGACV
jgi:hypothetical protein